MQAMLLTLSTIFTVISPITYILSILKEKTKPHRTTRFILFFVLAFNFFSILAAHGNVGAILFSGLTFLQAAIIFILSIWMGMGGSTKLDWSCLVIAGIGILGWKITGNPLLGMMFAIIADFVAYIPAFVKTWKYPHTENQWYYILGTVGAFFSLIAYPLELASLFQIYIVISCIGMIVFINRKKKK